MINNKNQLKKVLKENKIIYYNYLDDFDIERTNKK